MTRELKKNGMILTGFLAILFISNLHLLSNELPQSLIFNSEKVFAGQYWRIITYPFVHVSWYHLVLDGLVSVFLWCEIRALGVMGKLCLTFFISMTVLVVSLLFSPYIASTGLCGLSGIAHGLAIFAGLSQLGSETGGISKDKGQNLSAMVLLSVITGKCLYEVWSGQVLFNSLHFGELGQPIVHAHVGGALGGFISYLVWKARSAQEHVVRSHL